MVTMPLEARVEPFALVKVGCWGTGMGNYNYSVSVFCKRVLLFSGAAAFACAIGIFSSWQNEEMVLRKRALEITQNLDSDSARIRAVNDWVYHNKGFAKNDRHFIVPSLGPTPL